MTTASKPLRLPIWFGACLFGAIALFFLWKEHSVHILGAVPYLLLLACPLMHFLMHRGHHHHDASREARDGHSHRGTLP
jgi:hypothetical protein